MLHIHCIFRRHGNVYINISTTILNCSNSPYTTKIAWENATHQVVIRLPEPGHQPKHTAIDVQQVQRITYYLLETKTI